MEQLAVRVDQPGEDIWDMSALPGERAALEALLWNWGGPYEIGVDDGEWWFRRRDGKGCRETASTPDDLRAQIVTDYTVYPVPREHHSAMRDSDPAHEHPCQHPARPG